MVNDDMRRRFKNESKAMAVLDHPNVMRVYDVSFSDKMQSIVMEYIDGITLKEYIEQEGVLKWKDALHFTVQIDLPHENVFQCRRRAHPRDAAPLSLAYPPASDAGDDRSPRTAARLFTALPATCPAAKACAGDLTKL